MIFISSIEELNNYPNLPHIMRSQIYLIFLSFYPVQIKILESKEEYYNIQKHVEKFFEKHSFLKSVGCTEELKNHVIFPLNLYTIKATVFVNGNIKVSQKGG